MFCSSAARVWYARVYSLHFHLNSWLIRTLNQNLREILSLLCLKLIFHVSDSEKRIFSKIILHSLKKNYNQFSFKNISYCKVVFFEDIGTIYLCFFPCRDKLIQLFRKSFLHVGLVLNSLFFYFDDTRFFSPASWYLILFPEPMYLKAMKSIAQFFSMGRIKPFST